MTRYILICAAFFPIGLSFGENQNLSFSMIEKCRPEERENFVKNLAINFKIGVILEEIKNEPEKVLYLFSFLLKSLKHENCEMNQDIIVKFLAKNANILPLEEEKFWNNFKTLIPAVNEESDVVVGRAFWAMVFFRDWPNGKLPLDFWENVNSEWISNDRFLPQYLWILVKNSVENEKIKEKLGLLTSYFCMVDPEMLNVIFASTFELHSEKAQNRFLVPLLKSISHEIKKLDLKKTFPEFKMNFLVFETEDLKEVKKYFKKKNVLGELGKIKEIIIKN